MLTDLEASADLLRALAHPLRLAILRTLGAGERPVGEIEEESGIGQPSLSQQLAVLRTAGLVRTRRAARQVFYCTDHARLEQVTRLLQTLGGVTADPAHDNALARLGRGGGAAMFAQVRTVQPPGGRRGGTKA